MKLSLEVEGIDEALDSLKELDRRVIHGLAVGIRRVQRDWVTRSRLNAPILTGYLRKHLMWLPLMLHGARMECQLGSVGVHYALKMHEGLYNLGPISRIQPPTTEGGVGRKFMERVLKMHGLNAYLMMVFMAITEEIETLEVKQK